MTTIVIDPGHGGTDPGVVVDQLIEKVVTLSVARQLRKALLGLGWDLAVELTREGDEELSLAARGALSEKYAADLVLSLHCNSAPGPAQGAIAFHWPGSPTGEVVAKSIVRAMPQRLLRAKSNVFAATDDDGPGDDWLRRARNVLAPHKAPTVLIEMGFADDDDDRDVLMNAEGQRGIVAACVVGVAAALT